MKSLFRTTVGWKGLLWSLVFLAGLVGSLCTLTGFLDGVWWGFELTSHFRVQYAVILALLVLFFSFRKNFKLTTLFAAFALINFLVVLPLYFREKTELGAHGSIVRALLINVQTENKRYELAKAFIAECRPDFIALEEIDSLWMAQLEAIRKEYPHSVTQPREDNFGIGLFSKFPVKYSEILAILDVHGKPLTVLATHPLPPVSGGAAV